MGASCTLGWWDAVGPERQHFPLATNSFELCNLYRPQVHLSSRWAIAWSDINRTRRAGLYRASASFLAEWLHDACIKLLFLKIQPSPPLPGPSARELVRSVGLLYRQTIT